MFSLVFVQLKRKRNSNLFKYVFFDQAKNTVALFWGQKNIVYTFLFQIFFLALVPLSKRKHLQIILYKMLIFKVHGIFLNENFAECSICARLILWIFWNWTSKNIANKQICVHFRKSARSAKALHPTVWPWQCWSSCFCPIIVVENRANFGPIVAVNGENGGPIMAANGDSFGSVMPANGENFIKLYPDKHQYWEVTATYRLLYFIITLLIITP